MADADANRWNGKHARTADAPLGAPLESLQWLPFAPGALALDLACGRGRHCGQLLARGYHVVAVDASAVALTCVRRYHPTSALSRVRAHAEHWVFGPDVFDVVVQADFLDRSLFPAIKRSTRPGGVVLVDTFREHEGRIAGPSNPAFLLRQDELAAVFAEWEVVRHVGYEAESPREAILARKPATLTADRSLDRRRP